MDELNVLNAPKKVVDGLVEVFDGLAQMFAGVSEQLDMLAADAKTEDEPELPVAEQPVLPVTEKKGPAVSHPRKKPVKNQKGGRGGSFGHRGSRRGACGRRFWRGRGSSELRELRNCRE